MSDRQHKIVALVQANVSRDFFAAPGRLIEDLAGRPAVAHTLGRLRAVDGLDSVVLVCPSGQTGGLAPLAMQAGAVLLGYDRTDGPAWQGMRAARAFARYNWRGGLAGATIFDEQFDWPLIQAVAQRTGANSMLLVAGGAALLDVQWACEAVQYHRLHAGQTPMTFAQAPPGLAAGLFTVKLLEELSNGHSYPGRLLGYDPALPSLDPIGRPHCRPVPQHVMACATRFLADSPRGLWLCRQVLQRGGLQVDGATACRLAEQIGPEPWPREVTVELTTRRGVADDLRPHLADRHHGDASVAAGPHDMCLAMLRQSLAGLEEAGDVNVMLAGRGDPLLHPTWPEAVAAARSIGAAVGLATWGHALDSDQRRQVIESRPDVVEVYVDAVNNEAYAAHKRAASDGSPLPSVLNVWANIEALMAEIDQAGQTTPLVVPSMVKCRANLQEQDAFYDRALKLTGSARIVEPSQAAGQWPDRAVVHMAPPWRFACRRIDTRLTLLADGVIVACEEDLRAVCPLGHGRIVDAWRSQALASLREVHHQGRLDGHLLCGKCEEFHRP